VLAMHGDMFQAKREKVMGKLREGDLKVLVASDLASRGLDVEDITHVVNYDLPEDPEAYIHRIGRTARAGRDGVAWSFVCPDQGDLLSAIEQLANVEIPRKEYPDFTPGQVPVEVQQRREAEARKKEDLAKQRSRHEMVLPDPVAAKDSAKAAEMFPGGLVPVALPEKRLGGRLRSGRSR
jgi:superfamily II DNA/RNA helicase